MWSFLLRKRCPCVLVAAWCHCTWLSLEQRTTPHSPSTTPNPQVLHYPKLHLTTPILLPLFYNWFLINLCCRGMPVTDESKCFNYRLCSSINSEDYLACRCWLHDSFKGVSITYKQTLYSRRFFIFLWKYTYAILMPIKACSSYILFCFFGCGLIIFYPIGYS